MMAFRLGRVTFYPLRSAMHGAVNIWTLRYGYVCVKPPTRAFGRWWPAYFYLSPNATPWASTLLIGREYSRQEKRIARLRRLLWGHGYDPESMTSDPQSAYAYRVSLRELLGHELSEWRLNEPDSRRAHRLGLLRTATATEEERQGQGDNAS